MTKWEYKIVILEAEDADADQDELTRLGAQGWELVSVAAVEYLVPNDEDEDAIETMHVAYLKRPLP